MKEIRKKCWPKYFQEVIMGAKKFEVRLDNEDYEIGDTLLLQEWNPDTTQYTGREVKVGISSIIRTKDLEFWSQKEIQEQGLIIMSLMPQERRKKEK